MPKEKKQSFTLNTVDDMFTTQEVRNERRLPKIRELPLNAIQDFPDHPYKVQDDQDMMDLVESIRENGVLTPVTVRKIPGVGFEMISGHRRKRACELLGMVTIRGEVIDVDRDEAIIMMCDSNLQRTKILPSEKAKAYKMRLDAMKRMPGRRPKNNLVPVEQNFSREELANQVNESQTQIFRYIRLNELIPEILDMVDNGQIALRPAVEISYLPKEAQADLLDIMEQEACTPSHAQTIRMRRMLADENLTHEAILAIMQEEKPNQKERIVLRDDRARRLIPKDIQPSQREEYIIKALEFYGKHRKKQREKDLER